MLNRRKFMKAISIAIASPLVLLKAESMTPIPTHPIDVLIDLGVPDSPYMAEMRAFCDGYEYPSVGQKGEFILPIKDYKWFEIIIIRGGGDKIATG